MVIWYALLAVTLAVSIAIACVVLPRMFLKTRYTVTKSGDRCTVIIQEYGLNVLPKSIEVSTESITR